MQNLNISVIIPSYNSQKTIGLCLNALFNQRCGVGYEVIVVDCSSDDRVEHIISQYPKAIFIKETKRFNPGEGRNIGADKAKGDALVFLDADVIIESDTIEKIWFYYNKGFGVFNGAQEFMPYPRFSVFPFIEHCYFRHELQKQRLLTKRKLLNSTLLVCDKIIFHREGGFKNIPRMQDTELTNRFRRKAINLFFIPSIVSHVIYETGPKKLIKKLLINGNNNYYVKYKPYMSLMTKIIFRIALPALPFAKAMRIVVHHICYDRFKDKLGAIMISPAIFVCSICWAIGICNALICNRGISRER